jgi:hypothetical protein
VRGSEQIFTTARPGRGEDHGVYFLSIKLGHGKTTRQLEDIWLIAMKLTSLRLTPELTDSLGPKRAKDEQVRCLNKRRYGKGIPKAIVDF